MEIALLIIRLLLAAVFGVAGIAKMLDPRGSEKALRDFGVPGVLIAPLVILLPLAEISIAGLMLFTSVSWFGALGASLLLLIFVAGMSYQIAKGNAPDCHCFGQIHSEPVGKTSLIRNIVLFVIAAFLIANGRSFQGLSLVDLDQNIMQIVLGLSVIGLLTAILVFLLKMSEQQKQIMRRIELMELIARADSGVERDDAGNPSEGLPIGAFFPDFELPDTNGDSVSLATLLEKGKPVLFFFVSPTCNPCQALVPDFDEWQSALEDKVSLVFVSNRTSTENLEKFGGETQKVILLQKERETAELVRAQWTPTALLVDSNGRIASHVAAGDSAMRELVESVKARDLTGPFSYFTNGHRHAHGPQIGDVVPEHTLFDLDGNEINARHFQGKPTLVAFWSTTCPHCLNMMDELREWDKTKDADAPNLVVFSDGEEQTHKEIGLGSPIVLDKDYETAAKFGMSGTPSAVLINEDGKFASETAIGASDIWSLIGKRR